ncbi:MAG: D-alanyl-D-alanine carboxypeptidase [Lachnospiraceae bacterium]|nr:D-alanyl-D-alanine carboxypeptidase [Lachnospiraceae bacterium]
MESLLDNQKEQERETRRSERIEQLRREKQQQEERRRFIKKYGPLSIVVLGILLFVVVLVMVLGGKSEAGEEGKQTQNKAETEQIQESFSQQVESGQSGTEAVENSGDDINSANEDMGEVIAPTAAPTAEPIATTEPLYIFKNTDDTVSIYNEEVISTHAILINESTDTIIASKGARERISPASMTKVLTVLVAAEHISEENLDDIFTITLEYTDYAYINDCSTAGFLKDEQVTVRDLFYGTILPSGGDAAVALASYAAGSHEAFVELMNEKLEELGLADSAHFTNCVGLYDKEHYCTVYDMAVIMKAALQNDFCKEVLAAHTYTTTVNELHPEGNLLSNWFLRRIEDKDTGGEVLCAKTGYVDESQSCAVSYGIFANETPYICVTVGSSSSWRCIYDHVEIYTRYIQE